MMEQKKNISFELSSVPHLSILISYTILTAALIMEIFVMDWERGAIPFLLLGVGVSWSIDLLRRFSNEGRIWIYSSFMMLTFFFYGQHETSMYDIAPLMIVVLLVFSMTGMRSLLRLGIFTYYITLGYDLVRLILQGMELDALMVSRTCFHVALVTMAEILAAVIVSKTKTERGMYTQHIEQMDREQGEKTETLSIFSRELSVPAHVVSGDTLLLKSKHHELQGEMEFDTVYGAGKQLERQLSDIRDYAGIASGRVELQMGIYSPLELLYELRQEEYYRIEKLDKSIILDIEPDLPQTFHGDAAKLRKIIRHLLENGLRYAKEGSVRLKMYAVTRGSNVNLCIEVTDTGVGMEQAALARMTERLSAGVAASYRPGGLGLGLYIVYGFVAAMNGFVQMESIFGKGTRVCVSIPQKVANANPCMSFDAKSGLCIALLIVDQVFGHEQTADFYSEMHLNIEEKLHLPIYYLREESELDALRQHYRRVCYFVLQSKYEENPQKYEDMKDLFLAVIAGHEFVLPSGSRLSILRRPYTTENILHLLQKASKTILRRAEDMARKADSSKDTGALELPETVGEYVRRRRIRQRLRIVTDSMGDVPADLAQERGIGIIPFTVNTPAGEFHDNVEIGQESILAYITNGEKAYSMAPSEEAFSEFFRDQLKLADEILYISTSRGLSVSHERAERVAGDFPKVTLFNSEQVSGGLTLMVLEADDMAKAGKSVQEILERMAWMKERIVSTFVIDTLQYLVGAKWRHSIGQSVTQALMLRPVIRIRKGSYSFGALYSGDSKRVKEKYIRSILRQLPHMDRRRIAICYVGVSYDEIAKLKTRIQQAGHFEEVLIKKASAAISTNSGPGMVGILFLRS